MLACCSLHPQCLAQHLAHVATTSLLWHESQMPQALKDEGSLGADAQVPWPLCPHPLCPCKRISGGGGKGLENTVPPGLAWKPVWEGFQHPDL